MEYQDPMRLADECVRDLNSLRMLLGAAEDKVRFYLEDPKLLGPYAELLQGHAMDLDHILVFIKHFAEKLDGELDVVTDILYHQPCAAK